MDAAIYQQYKDQMNDFPCAFNLEHNGILSPARLKHIHKNLESDLKNLDCGQCEGIRLNNLLTWILFLLDKHDEAAQLNNECVNQTNSSGNIASLGNRFFILCQTGDELGADQCLQDLQMMKDREDYPLLLTEAKAEQAYYYSRLGGVENLKWAIRLFSEVTEEQPENYLWTFGLGLCCRRATNVDIVCSSQHPLDVDRYKKRAADCFFQVAEKGDSRLKSLAHAQLVTLYQDHPSDDLFRGLTILQLCEAALQHGPLVPTALTRCGIAVRDCDIDKSIELLEKSLSLRENTITCHHLAISYHKKAEQLTGIPPLVKHVTDQKQKSCETITEEHKQIVHGNTDLVEDCKALLFPSTKVNNRNEQFAVTVRNETILSNSPTESTKLQQTLRARVSKYISPLSLSRDNQYVRKACACYKRAIDLSKVNAPAIIDLGMLLKQTGQLNEALVQFNKVTNSHLVFADHRVSVISANEQAGLCYLELSKSQNDGRFMEEKAKLKLTTAISLAADLALVNPELKNCVKDVWTAFRTLEADINQGFPSVTRSKQLIKLLQLIRDYGQVIDVVQKIREFNDDHLNDQTVIMTVIDSYLNLKQPENALAFLKLVAMKPDVVKSTWWNTDCMRDLKRKVLFDTLTANLGVANGNPKPLFQQLFELVIGTRYLQCGNEITEADAHLAGDILIVFDDEEDDQEESANEGSTSTTKVASCLKDVASQLFGLQAEINLQASGEYGDTKAELQLREMTKYPVIITVVRNKQGGGIFTSILKCMASCLKFKHLAILSMDADLGDYVLPLSLKQFKWFSMDDIGLGCIQNNSHEGGASDQPYYIDVVSRVFGGDVKAVLKLFCFMIGHSYDCFA